MRITCDACQAKYSIADDKVSGKVFKIRCKKCSHVIVVRGSAPAVQPAPEPVAPVADDAIWYLVIDQDQVGPLTVAEVERRFAAGAIDRDTFAWREGLADWEPLAHVAELAAVVASAPAPGQDAAQAAHDDAAGDDAASADLFAPAIAPRRDTDDVVTARAGRDMFGDGAGMAASAAASTRLRGERNESSVLFSLNNLAQIANRAPAPVSTSTTATGATPGEGSGLIDIRSMASAYLGSGTASAAAGKPATTIGSIDDLPVFGGGGFSEPAVLVPSARAAASSKLLYLMIGAVAVLAAVAVVLVVMLMKSKHADAQPASPPVEVAQATPEAPPATPPPAAAPVPASPPASPPAVPTTNDHPAAATATTTTASHATSPASPPTHATSPAHHATTPPATHATTPATHAATPATPPPPGDGGCDKVTCAFNGNEGACCAKFRETSRTTTTTTTTTTTASDLPESLDVAKIQAGIGTVKAHAQACGDRSPAKGKVKVHFKVNGDGHVTNVSVESSPDAALGACVQAAAQKASFVKTQRGGSFNYTFVF